MLKRFSREAADSVAITGNSGKEIKIPDILVCAFWLNTFHRISCCHGSLASHPYSKPYKFGMFYSFSVLVVLSLASSGYSTACTTPLQMFLMEKLKNRIPLLMLKFLKDLEHLWLAYIRIMHQSWDTVHLLEIYRKGV